MTDEKNLRSPDDLNCRIVGFLLAQSIDELVESFVRGRLELGEVVAQVGYFIHRIFTFKSRRGEENQ